MPGNLSEFKRKVEAHNAPTATLSTFGKIKIALSIRKTFKDPAMKDRIASFASRKFLAALAGAVLVTTLNHLGAGAEVTQQIVTLVVGYIVGQGAVDAVKEYKA